MSPISLISVVLLAVPVRDTVPAQEDTAIARIRREYAAVNAGLARCAHREQDAFGMTTEGGSLEVYRCGGTIRKLVATFYGEMGQSRDEWYLEGEQPFFFFSVEQRYDRPLGRGGVMRRHEERVYLRGGEMLRWMGDDETRSVTSADARGRMGELADEAAELLDRARTGRTFGK
jgi:hypothetical protein